MSLDVWRDESDTLRFVLDKFRFCESSRRKRLNLFSFRILMFAHAGILPWMFARSFSMAVRLTAISTIQMARLEKRGERLGVSKLVMMENAGAGIARLVYERCHDSDPRTTRVLIIAGTGNNGG